MPTDTKTWTGTGTCVPCFLTKSGTVGVGCPATAGGSGACWPNNTEGDLNGAGTCGECANWPTPGIEIGCGATTGYCKPPNDILEGLGTCAAKPAAAANIKRY